MRATFRAAASATSVAGLAAATFLAVPDTAMAAPTAPLAADAAVASSDMIEIASEADMTDVALSAAPEMPSRERRVASPREFRAAPARAMVRAQAPARAISLSVGTGQLIVLPRAISGMFVADEKIADVNVKSTTQLYLFGKTPGQTSVYATDRSGAVVWSSQVRVGANIADIAPMLRTAMPEQDIRVTNLAGMVMLTGTVLAPKDAEEAQRLTELFTSGGVQVINHLAIATPQQVALHVKIAEVSRSVSRAIGLNYNSISNPGGFQFGIGQGRDFISDDKSKLLLNGIGSSLFFGGKLLGVNVRTMLDLAEQDGLVTTLAEPNLVALSGETASFLAGGEIPIPQSQGLGAVSVQFKQYGVSLSFTPTVLSAGRISMRVRPEVSQLSDSGSVKLNGFTIPSLTTRRAETTVELGSGQSFVIGGLLQNTHNNSVDKAPLLGDLPILGSLFRSNAFRKQETELLIVVTPYIVKPIDANQVALPSDGYRSALPLDRIIGDKQTDGHSDLERPKPRLAPAPAPLPATGRATAPASPANS